MPMVDLDQFDSKLAHPLDPWPSHVKVVRKQLMPFSSTSLQALALGISGRPPSLAEMGLV
jgi:hypothetical protein